jgi:hypothetical protein
MDSLSSRIRAIVFLSFLGAFMVAACSGMPEATKSIETLNLVANEPTADAFTPRVVLTIPPTESPVPTATKQEPTATKEITPTQTATQPAETPTSLPTNSPSLTATVQNTEPTVVQQNLSACPQGCSVPPPGCLIKGNINNEGVKIYHVPGQDYYDKTKISPEKDERWFCTPAEAEANGWRPTKR